MALPGWAGRIIDGRYVVESVIGAGGMGLVLKARHKFTGADVALKVLKPELELDTEVQMRFLAEARAPTAIGHPGIVSVIDAGKAPDGLLYLVMELLLGKPLRTPLARGELTAADMRRILLELLDFGIAKVLDAGLARVKTQTGTTLGTPAYMAPEQFHDPSGVDTRADLWAVGVMTYEMLAGRLPFRADTAQAMLVAVATLEPDPINAHLPAAPPSVDAFFRRALARDRNHRFASAAEMATALAALPLGTHVAPQPTQRAHRPSATPPPTGPVGMGSTMATGYGGTQATGYGGTQATGWQTPAPMQTPAPLAHPAPPAASTPSRPVAVLTPSGPVPTLAPQPTGKKAWVLGLGLASVVSIAIVIVAVAMTRRSTSSGTDPGSGSGSGSGSAMTVAHDPPPAPVDAAVVAQAPPEPVDAGPISAQDKAAKEKALLGILDPNAKAKPTPDAGVAAAKPPKRPSQPDETEPDEDDKPAAPAPQLTTQELCSRACTIAIQKCGIASATCLNDCMATDELQKCARQPFTSCNAAAICGMRATCGGTVLRGSGTCAQAATCQASCSPGDFACGCACARAMSASKAAALSALDACAINCKFNNQCIANYCQRQGQTCAVQ